VPDCNCVLEWDLRQSIQEEETAIRAYNARRAEARRAGHAKLADKYDEIKKEEEHHLQELQNELAKLHSE
jgi:rubrerythrin